MVLKIEIVPPEGSNAFSEIKDKKITIGRLHGVAIYPKGTRQGGVSVGFIIEMPDGTFVHTETTSGILDGVAAAVQGAVERYVGDPDVQ